MSKRDQDSGKETKKDTAAVAATDNMEACREKVATRELVVMKLSAIETI